MAGHHYGTVIKSSTSKIVSGAIVYVYEAGATVDDPNVTGGTHATIYSDDGVTTVDQSTAPITSDANGFFEFWTDETSVVLQYYYDGAARKAIDDVEIVGGTVASDVTALAARVDKHDTLFGTAASATDLGTFTGSTISDNTDVVTALQELETDLETRQAGDAGLTDIAGLAVTDGNIIVGDGANWVAESGATARTSLGAAGTSQTDEAIAGMLLSPADQDYKIVVKAPHGGTITETTTICASGTCTATFKINTTALGGTANSVSSSEQSQAHSTSNAFSAGDDIVITISSNSSCTDMSFTIKYTRTLA